MTGAQTSLATGISDQLQKIQAATNTPIAVGFGISTPIQASTVACMADGVVVGSAIVKLIEEHGTHSDLSDRLTAFVKPLVDAVKAV